MFVATPHIVPNDAVPGLKLPDLTYLPTEPAAGDGAPEGSVKSGLAGVQRAVYRLCEHMFTWALCPRGQYNKGYLHT